MNVFCAMGTVRSNIRYSFALAAFADEWANAIEKGRSNGRRDELPSLSGCEILNVVPADKMPRDYLEFAEEAIRKTEEKNGRGIVAIAHEVTGSACLYSESYLTDKFGHYLYMQSVGHGVGLSDEFGDRVEYIKVPYVCAPLAVVEENIADYL